MKNKQLAASLAAGAAAALFCMFFYTLRTEDINGAPIPGVRGLLYSLSFFMTLLASAPLRALGLLNINSFLNNLLVFIVNFSLYGVLCYFFQVGFISVRERLSAGSRLIKGAEAAVLAFLLISFVSVCLLLRSDVGRYEITRYSLPLKNLPEEMEGLRIVLAADLHVGWYSRDAYIKRAAELINAEKPDIIIMAGDFVFREGEVSFYKAAEWLKSLKPGIALLGVLGNHDNWQGHEFALRILPESGLIFLDNRRVFLDAERRLRFDMPERGLCLAGVGDEWTDSVDFEAALGGVREDMPRIAVSHIPDVVFDYRTPYRIDLMLSGHTHGGQIVLPFFGPLGMSTSYGEKLLKGWGKDTLYPVYINVGLGETVLPFRYGVRPEITVFDLRSE